jgi:hypothetical protein
MDKRKEFNLEPEWEEDRPLRHDEVEQNFSWDGENVYL